MNTKHLKEVKMSYGQHLLFTLTIAMEGIVMSHVLLIHGIVPIFLEKRFSNWIGKCHARIKG